MPTWKITLEYDGSNYHGWQEQTNAKAVASEIRKAAEEFLGATVELQGSGRTDAGVHALAQVAHMRADCGPLTPAEVLNGLNGKLPTSIVVLEVEETHGRFHARHDAVSRSYVYRLSTRRTAFEKKYVWWIREKLDISRMQLAAQKLIGRHDFSAFAQKDPSKPDDSSIVVVNEAGVLEEDNLILFRIEASHFLWKMVRRLAGVLVRVGTSELALSEVDRFLRGEADTRIATWTAPASGLFLERVSYEAAPAVAAPSHDATGPERETATGKKKVARVSAGDGESRPSASPARSPYVRGDRGDSDRGGDRGGGSDRDRGGSDRGGDGSGDRSSDRPPAPRTGGFGDSRPPRRDYGDKPAGKFGRPAGRFDDSRPPRRDYGDKPAGTFSGRSATGRFEKRDDGPPRRDYGDKPAAKFGRPAGRFDDSRPPRRDYGDKPAGAKFTGRSASGRFEKRDDGPPRRDYGDKPAGAKFGGRSPSGRFEKRDDGPPRRDYGDKPAGAKFGGRAPSGRFEKRDDGPPRRDYSDKPGRFEKGDDSRPPRRDYGTGAPPRSTRYEDRGASRGSDAPYPARPPRRPDADRGGARGDGPSRPRTPFGDSRNERAPRGAGRPDDRDQRPSRGPRSFDGPKFERPKGPGGPKKFGAKKSFGGPKKFGASKGGPRGPSKGPKKFGGPKRGGKPPRG